MKLLAVYLLFGFFILPSSHNIGVLVKTKYGIIEGEKAVDGDYIKFMGVPYGKVDVLNPFGLSLPPQKFKGIFKANNDSFVCPQILANDSKKITTLDCLLLNIYVPNSDKYPLPVLFYIHGGVFTFGSGYRWGPKYLMKQHIILVTINYRLGPYGFLCLDTPRVSANQAMKDQTRALRWVKENILDFGGDPHKITISGTSAGGFSVDFHLRSHQEKLFDKAIIQSGAGLIPVKITKELINVPMRIAKYIGFDTNNLDEALLFLAIVEPQDVIKASTELKIDYCVCAEKKIDGVDAFISEESYDYPKLDNVTIIIGFAEYEAFVQYSKINITSNAFYTPLRNRFDLEPDVLSRIKEIARHFYIGDKKIDDKVLFPVINFYSDVLFVYPSLRTIDALLYNNAKSVYVYMFCYVGERNLVKVEYKVKEKAAVHADDLGYIFDIVPPFDKPVTDEDQLMIDRLTTLWGNFIKYGDPTPRTTTLLPLKWEPMTKHHWNYLIIDRNMKMDTSLLRERKAFWDLLFLFGYGKTNEAIVQKQYELGTGRVLTQESL